MELGGTSSERAGRERKGGERRKEGVEGELVRKGRGDKDRGLGGWKGKILKGAGEQKYKGGGEELEWGREDGRGVAGG